MMTARTAAIQILTASRAHQAFIGELLDQQLQAHPLSAPDRRLLTNLVYGILRRQGSLDALLRPFMRRSLLEVDPDVLDLLRLGAFQIAFLTHIPPHAAVFETVEVANQIKPQAKGFVNGVLRRIVELMTDDFVTKPGPHALPFDTGRYRRMTQGILPDPQYKPAGYIEAGMSWPTWMANLWMERFGFERCLQLGFWFNSPGAMWLRANPLQNDRETLQRRLTEAGIGTEPGRHPQSLRLLESHGIRDLPGYDDGAFAIQDPSAMRVAMALNPSPGMRVLDLCAAPGGKTTHLAELMQNTGHIDAYDIESDRLATIQSLADRLRITIIEPKLRDGGFVQGEYDAALVDVPCSNTGVLGRRPEVRWRLKLDEIPYLTRLQSDLLHEAANVVKPGGKLVYSTCSIEPDENGLLVRSVIASRNNLVLDTEEESFPGEGGDGGYWARLTKR